MKRQLFLLTILLLGLSLLVGCTVSPSTAQPTASTVLISTSSPTPDPRFALVKEAVNDVMARPHPEDTPIPAKPGMKIYPGGDVQTGDESRATLLLMPEETIIRIGANTHFVLKARDPAEGQTMLQMIMGKIWIILKGGSLDIETPSGTASVRGSLMSAGYNTDGALQVACMEGHCSLRSTTGETVELTGGQAAVIPSPGAAPSAPFPIPAEEWQEWQEIAPDALQGIPTPTLTPPPTPTAQPSAYRLTNNCDEVWHWRFSGPQSISLDIPPHTTVSGLLPGGTYTAVDWVGENGEQHTTGPIDPGGYISATSCR